MRVAYARDRRFTPSSIERDRVRVAGEHSETLPYVIPAKAEIHHKEAQRDGELHRAACTHSDLLLLDHDPQEVLYGFLRVIREARVDRRGLHHCAARRDEPPEALALRQHAHGAGFVPTLAHPARDLEVCLHGLGVEVGVEHPQAFRVEVDARIEELRVLAVEHHPRVYELPALDARYHAQEGVLEKAHRVVSSNALTHPRGSCKRVLR